MPSFMDRLFGKEKRQRFDRAYDRLDEVAQYIGGELRQIQIDQTKQREMDSLLRNFRSLEYLQQMLDAVIALRDNGNYKNVFDVLPVTASMYVTVVDKILGHSSYGLSDPNRFFPTWLNMMRIELGEHALQIAYILTSNEQKASGTQLPSAFAMRVVLASVAARIHPRGQDLSKKFAGYF